MEKPTVKLISIENVDEDARSEKSKIAKAFTTRIVLGVAGAVIVHFAGEFIIRAIEKKTNPEEETIEETND